MDENEKLKKQNEKLRKKIEISKKLSKDFKEDAIFLAGKIKSILQDENNYKKERERWEVILCIERLKIRMKIGLVLTDEIAKIEMKELKTIKLKLDKELGYDK